MSKLVYQKITGQQPPSETAGTPPTDGGEHLSSAPAVYLLTASCALSFLGLLGFYVTLIIPPPTPTFYPQFQINSFSVTNFNQTLSSNQVSGNWDFDFSATNFNTDDDMGFSFKNIMVSLFKKNDEEPIWVTILKPFELRPMSIKFHIPGRFYGPIVSVDGITRFDVKFESGTKNKKFGTGLLTAYCKDVEIFVSGETGKESISSGSMDCYTQYKKVSDSFRRNFVHV